MQIPELLLPVKSLTRLDPEKPFDKYWVAAEHPTEWEVEQLDLQLLQYLAPFVINTGKGFSVLSKDNETGPYILCPPEYPQKYLLLPKQEQRANVFALFSQTEKGIIGVQSLSFHEYKSLVIRSLELPYQRDIRKDNEAEDNRLVWRKYNGDSWGWFNSMEKTLVKDRPFYALLAEALIETGKTKRISYHADDGNWAPPSDAIIPTKITAEGKQVYICLSGLSHDASFLFTPNYDDTKIEGSLAYPKHLNYLNYIDDDRGEPVLFWSQNPYTFKVFLAQALAELG